MAWVYHWILCEDHLCLDVDRLLSIAEQPQSKNTLQRCMIQGLPSRIAKASRIAPTEFRLPRRFRNEGKLPSCRHDYTNVSPGSRSLWSLPHCISAPMSAW